MTNKSEQNIAQLQMMQQRVAVFSSQKQQFQMQLIELETARKEVASTKKPVYRLVGGILVEKSATEVKKDLDKVKKDLDLRVKNLEKQEQKAQSQMIDLQKEITKTLK